MSHTTEHQQFLDLLRQSHALHRSGQQTQALAVLDSLGQLWQTQQPVLELRVSVHLAMGEGANAMVHLHRLLELFPDETRYYDMAANILSRSGHSQQAVEIRQTFSERFPRSANGQFNLAFQLREDARFEQAIEAYQRALDLDVDGKEEVLLNIANILNDDLHRHQEALAFYQKALEIKPDYYGAAYNLASLYERLGRQSDAIDGFYRLRNHTPGRADAISRWLELFFYRPRAELASRLAEAIALYTTCEANREDVINLGYAIANAQDKLGQFEQAMITLSKVKANESSQRPAYQPEQFEQYIDRIIKVFDTLELPVSNHQIAPVFICGMFRSGSTLFERILGAHPAITAGGELDYFPRLLATRLKGYPESLCGLKADEVQSLADAYLPYLARVEKNERLVTDKRPDNFILLGLVKALFPNAKIFWTVRDLPDNCLSAYFLRLGPAMSYSARLEWTAHYYRQQARLMTYWQQRFGHDIMLVNYDKLVADAESQVRPALDFLGLEWDPVCLDFHRNQQAVSTASVNQIRQPLYSTSSGRWRNYQPWLPQELF